MRRPAPRAALLVVALAGTPAGAAGVNLDAFIGDFPRTCDTGSALAAFRRADAALKADAPGLGLSASLRAVPGEGTLLTCDRST